MHSPYPSKAIANEFLKLAAKSNSADVSPMKLQKLVYFADAWNLAFHNDPLIKDEIQAWQYGPVIEDVYHEFKDFGNSRITRMATDIDFSAGKFISSEPEVPSTDHETHNLLKEIWRVYGKFSPIQLSNLTHASGTPWSMVANAYGSQLPRGVTIPNELIKQHFKAILEGNKK